MPIEGNIDSIDSRGVRGWVWEVDSPEPCLIQIFDGDHLFAELKAADFREDLKQAGKGEGHCAFRFWFPPEIFDGQWHTIRVEVKGEGDCLPHSKKEIRFRDSYDLPLPAFESPFYPAHIRPSLDPELREVADSLRGEGFAVLPEFISSETADAIVAEVNPYFEEQGPAEKQRKTRLQDGWKAYRSVKNLACQERILDVLKAVYGRAPIPFQTLNFKFGTQQSAHSDRIHFSSLPEGFMCGVWVALEDVSPENGTLFYLKHSHRETDWKNHDLMWDYQSFNYPIYQHFIAAYQEATGVEKIQFEAKKGDALIWSSKLIHGGSPVLQPDSTRWSQVTHYFFEDCIYFTPLFSDMIAGEYFLRSVTNITTGEPVEHRFNGARVETTPTEKPNRFRVQIQS